MREKHEMAKELPYVANCKNLPALFERIKTARVPEAFTHKFMYETIGLKSVADRSLITLLKKLGFLDQGGKPTQEYPLLKNPKTQGPVIATGIRRAYNALFDANESAHALNPEDARGLIAQVTGAEERTVKLIAYTFSNLVKLADFSSQIEPSTAKTDRAPDDEEEVEQAEVPARPPRGMSNNSAIGSFHFNIQVHLPANGTEETYLNIFSALRKALN